MMSKGNFVKRITCYFSSPVFPYNFLLTAFRSSCFTLPGEWAISPPPPPWWRLTHDRAAKRFHTTKKTIPENQGTFLFLFFLQIIFKIRVVGTKKTGRLEHYSKKISDQTKAAEIGKDLDNGFLCVFRLFSTGNNQFT